MSKVTNLRFVGGIIITHQLLLQFTSSTKEGVEYLKLH